MTENYKTNITKLFSISYLFLLFTLLILFVFVAILILLLLTLSYYSVVIYVPYEANASFSVSVLNRMTLDADHMCNPLNPYETLRDKLREVSNRVNTSVTSAYMCFYLVCSQVADTYDAFARVFVHLVNACSQERQRRREVASVSRLDRMKSS